MEGTKCEIEQENQSHERICMRGTDFLNRSKVSKVRVTEYGYNMKK